MLMPKRVKYRRVHRGRMKGVATKGNEITYAMKVYRLVPAIYKNETPESYLNSRNVKVI